MLPFVLAGGNADSNSCEGEGEGRSLIARHTSARFREPFQPPGFFPFVLHCCVSGWATGPAYLC